MKTKGGLALLGALLLAFALAAGCSSGGSGTGTMAIRLTDASKDLGITEVWVTIDSIEVHRAGDAEENWMEVVPNAEVSTPLTVDLLDLQNGITMDLGLHSLPAGHYTQIRLKLGDDAQPRVPEHPFPNYVVVGDQEEPLTIPSGFQSGLKLYHEFWIQEDTLYEIALDIDTMRIRETGHGDYKMKPTIRAIEIDLSGKIVGTVAAAGDCVDVEGVTVMAQQQDDPTDPTSVRIVQTAFVTEDSPDHHSYTLAFLPPGTYNVVAYKDDPVGEQVAFGTLTGVVVEAGQTTPDQDILLECNPRLDVLGTVDLDPSPAQPTDVIPEVRAVLTDEAGPDFIVAVAGAPWDDLDEEYSPFSFGLWDGHFTFVYEAEGYETKTVTEDITGATELDLVTLTQP